MDGNGKQTIEEWFNENLEPIFNALNNAISETKADNLYRYFLISFKKNSMPIFEGLCYISSSYVIGQEMRYLMELTADLNYINKNPDNIKYIEEEANRYFHELDSGKKGWEKCVVSSGNVKLREVRTCASPKDNTINRVKNIFDTDIYSLYSSFSHVNLFVICDDACTITDENKLRRRRFEMIKYYPMILDKFIKVIGESLNLNTMKNINFDSFENNFNNLKKAVLNMKRIE